MVPRVLSWQFVNAVLFWIHFGLHVDLVTIVKKTELLFLEVGKPYSRDMRGGETAFGLHHSPVADNQAQS